MKRIWKLLFLPIFICEIYTYLLSNPSTIGYFCTSPEVSNRLTARSQKLENSLVVLKKVLAYFDTVKLQKCFFLPTC